VIAAQIQSEVMLELVIREPKKDSRRVALERRTYTLGRDPRNDIVILDEYSSREHAAIVFDSDEEKFVIEDLGSKSGVYLNGKRTKKRAFRKAGDKVELGETSILLEQPKHGEKDSKGIGLSPFDKTKPLVTEKLHERLQGVEGTRILAPGELNIPQDGFRQEPRETVILASDEAHESVPVKSHKLIVISKNDFGKEYLLDRPEVRIGRGQDCSVRIDDKTVSFYHAAVLVRGDECVLRDLNSQNGTLLDGIRLTGEQPLSKGAEISIGPTILKFIDRDMVITK